MKRYPNTTVLLSYMLVILCACSSLMLVSFKNKSHRLFKVPVITNKGKGAPICLAPNFMMKASHVIERVEKFGDTLDLSIASYLNAEKVYLNNSDDNYFNDSGLRIIVDTHNEVGVSIRPGMTKVQGLPVYIINEGVSKIVELETKHGKLNMLVEAMSSKNTWEPIEYASKDSEKESTYKIKLLPQQYAFTKNIMHCGDHATKCRIKLQNGTNIYYSNEFMMGINYTQFEKI